MRKRIANYSPFRRLERSRSAVDQRLYTSSLSPRKMWVRAQIPKDRRRVAHPRAGDHGVNIFALCDDREFRQLRIQHRTVLQQNSEQGWTHVVGREPIIEYFLWSRRIRGNRLADFFI